MSYTTFEFSDLTIKATSAVDIEASVTVKNTGNLSGAEVVQLYVSYPNTGVTQPPLQLRGFAKVHEISPGSSKVATITLDKYAFSFWDPSLHVWRVAAGEYVLHVGRSSDDLALKETFKVEKGFTWEGL